MQAVQQQTDILTIHGAVARAKSEGLPVAECAVRRWIKTGALPVRWAGNKALIYYPSFVRFLSGDDPGKKMGQAV